MDVGNERMTDSRIACLFAVEKMFLSICVGEVQRRRREEKRRGDVCDGWGVVDDGMGCGVVWCGERNVLRGRLAGQVQAVVKEWWACPVWLVSG